VNLPSLIYPPGMTLLQAMRAGLVEPVRSETYLRWVRGLPSVMSARTGCVAHHLVGHGLKAKGGKVCDLMTFPLQPLEHRGAPGALHDIGSAEWERRHGDQQGFVMVTLLEAVYRGVLRTG
jgi:hypothetical protein